MHYLCSQNKGADQLHGNRVAVLRFCFHICKSRSSHDTAHIVLNMVPCFQVRVPTHEDGSCLFWEFATDYYDIGFGVYFEWTIAPSNTVSVHVSESSDEEDLDEEGEWG